MRRNESRETTILAAVIEQYTRTGEPVPSADIARETSLGLSPASIRSVMVKLAEQGYLEQPHISSGRVPTPKAFRLYVDTVLAPEPLGAAEKAAINSALDPGDVEIPYILRRASALVSNRCLQLGVVLAPRRDELRWRGIEFSLVAPRLVLAVLILDGGLVRTRMVTVPQEYTAEELAYCSNYLNSHFRGYALSEARVRMERELEQAGEQLEAMCRRALALSRPALEANEEDREVFMDGIREVSHTATFSGAARLRELLSFLEERQRLLELLERTMESRDISVSFLQGDHGTTPWAVVSAPYAPHGEGAPLGVVGAVGLLHMDYATVLPVVAHIAGSLASVLERRLDPA